MNRCFSILCPHCYRSQSSTWDEYALKEDFAIMVCEYCDQKFQCQREVAITYVTDKV